MPYRRMKRPADDLSSTGRIPELTSQKQTTLPVRKTANQVERKGVEPSTFALRTRRATVASETGKELTTTLNPACTRACTSNAEIAHETAAAASAGIPLDDDLAAVVEAWGTLPAAVRAGIVAMVRAARQV